MLSSPLRRAVVVETARTVPMRRYWHYGFTHGSGQSDINVMLSKNIVLGLEYSYVNLSGDTVTAVWANVVCRWITC